MTKHLNREQRAADQTDDGVHDIPRSVDPRYFIGEKLEEVQNARNADDERIAERLERLVSGRERDPMLIDREPGDKDGEVKIHTCEAGETERDAENVKPFHGKIIGAAIALSRAFTGAGFAVRACR